MILTDSSIWIDHLRRPDVNLANLVRDRQVLVHPFVIGEIALGSIKDRAMFLRGLAGLPRVEVALHDEVLSLVERRKLFARGLSYIDVHLLAATLIAPDALLWTRDRRLDEAARELGVVFVP